MVVGRVLLDGPLEVAVLGVLTLVGERFSLATAEVAMNEPSRMRTRRSMIVMRVAGERRTLGIWYRSMAQV